MKQGKMNLLENEFEAAIKSKDLPGAVLTSSNANGELLYSKSFGPQYLDDENSRHMDENPVFWIASCTKLMTTVAAMQGVERGLFTLDEDITRLLPEWKNIEIIKGSEKGSNKPFLEKSSKKITLRHLLTHSSGISYDHFNPILKKYRAWQGISPDMKGSGKTSENYFYPLLFEPGSSWDYGAGIDWAGIMVQRANETVSLGEYMKHNIWKPLGMIDTTFHLETRPDLRARIVDMAWREGDTHPLFGITTNPDGKISKSKGRGYPIRMEDDVGGAGAYSTPSDYHKLLNSLIANDGKVLKKETVDEMFKPQLSKAAKANLNRLLSIPEMCMGMGSPLSPLAPGSPSLDFGLGGMLTTGPTEYENGTGRSSGTMYWSGLPNLLWWMDRSAGVCGTLFSQLMPLGDMKTQEILRKFEVGIYERSPSL